VGAVHLPSPGAHVLRSLSALAEDQRTRGHQRQEPRRSRARLHRDGDGGPATEDVIEYDRANGQVIKIVRSFLNIIFHTTLKLCLNNLSPTRVHF